jgi:hypothetical protein
MSPNELPRVLRRGSATSRMLGLRVRILLGAWMSVSCVCFVLTGRDFYTSGLSLVQRSPTEGGASEPYHETSIIRRP